MKFFKYIIIAMASLVALVSCEKHDLAYQMEHIDAEDKALVVVWRLIPEASTTANRVYNITIDDQPLWGNNYTYMAAQDWMPNQSRHYIMEPGVHNMKWFLQDGTEVYNQNFTAIAGMQEVCVTDYNAAPIVIDNNAEYPCDLTEHTAESFYLRFVNFMYADENYTIPEYKLQYWYQDPTDLEWYPASDPVGFGEASAWYRIHIDQFAPERSGESGNGSSRFEDNNRVGYTVTAGSCSIYYKIKMIGANGEDLGWFTYNRKGGAEESDTEYKDYWTGNIGQHRIHYLRGCRMTNGGTTSNTAVWVTQASKH